MPHLLLCFFHNRSSRNSSPRTVGEYNVSKSESGAINSADRRVGLQPGSPRRPPACLTRARARVCVCVGARRQPAVLRHHHPHHARPLQAHTQLVSAQPICELYFILFINNIRVDKHRDKCHRDEMYKYSLFL